MVGGCLWCLFTRILNIESLTLLLGCFAGIIKRVLHESTGRSGQVPGSLPGTVGKNCGDIQFNAQAAWILLRTPLKPRFWSTFVSKSHTVSRFSSFPMLVRIDAQAAAIRAALLQNAKQSNDFYNFLNLDIPDCNIKRHMSRSMHRLQGLSSQASHSFTLCKEYAPIGPYGYMCTYRYRSLYIS